MNRSVDSCDLFLDDQDRQQFLTLIAAIGLRYGIEIHVHCLMPNHYHLQIRSTQGRISEAMRDLGGRYARYYNRRHQRRGALFAGRFKSILITTDRQLIATWAYILRNPTSLGVTDLASYRWSSAAAYLRRGPVPAWLHIETIARHLGRDHIAGALDSV